MKKMNGFIVLLLFLFIMALPAAYLGCSKRAGRETVRETTFAEKKAKIDPRTGYPETLDPNGIPGEDRKGYEVAKEIPEILAQMPCFCGCEAFGHRNLLDCFVDEHGVG